MQLLVTTDLHHDGRWKTAGDVVECGPAEGEALIRMGRAEEVEKRPAPGADLSAAAYLVVGPESSGTRMVTELLIAAGCEGDCGHTQRWDQGSPEAADHPMIVWRRSVPHAGRWPDIAAICADLVSAGYGRLIVLVTVRDATCLERSQVMRRHVGTCVSARENISRCYRHIFKGLARADGAEVVMVSYEALLLHGDLAAAALLERIGIDGPGELVITDQNAKHYGRRQ